MWPTGQGTVYFAGAGQPERQQLDTLVQSIRTFGFNNPVLITEQNEIVAGHGRVRSVKRLKMKTVPCVVLSHLDEKLKRAYCLADNRIAEQGGWDDDLLTLELNELKALSVDLELAGFSDEDWLRLMPVSPKTGKVNDDYVPEISEGDPICCSGDIWQMGDHQLLCGDATKRENLYYLMNDHLADMIWVDPPYNVNYEGSTQKRMTIRNDDMKDQSFRDFLEKLFQGCYRVSKTGAPIYVAYADSESINFRSALQVTGWKISQTLVWIKNQFILSRQDYHWQHEPILYGWKDDGAHPWFGGKTWSTLVEAEPALDDMTRDELLKLCQSWKQILSLSAIQAKKPLANTDHPTMKPVYLVMRMILNSSQRDDTVLDPCAGSGTTLIACEKLQRKACLVELDPRYCDVILKRWQAFTGSPAIHAQTKEPFNKGLH